jgi:hypothetical protein
MEIFEFLAAIFDVTFGIVDVVSLVIDLASPAGGDESRPR